MFSIITYFLVYFPIVKVAFILLCHIFVFSKQTPRFLIIFLDSLAVPIFSVLFVGLVGC